MGLDVRLPMGALFSILGAMVMVYGLSNSYSADVRWGGAMLLFGIACLALASHAMAVARKDAAAVKEAVPVKSEE